MSGIHHVSIGVNDVPRAKAFYDPLMKIIGLRIRQSDDEYVDYGSDIGLVFSLETPLDKRAATPGNGVHITFSTSDRRTVDTFYQEALRLGGRDAGPPGLRPEYSPEYYGAFVFDPDGNKIEAVVDEGGSRVKRKALRFGKGFRVALGNRRCQAAEMVIDPGKAEGGPKKESESVDKHWASAHRWFQKR